MSGMQDTQSVCTLTTPTMRNIPVLDTELDSNLLINSNFKSDGRDNTIVLELDLPKVESLFITYLDANYLYDALSCQDFQEIQSNESAISPVEIRDNNTQTNVYSNCESNGSSSLEYQPLHFDHRLEQPHLQHGYHLPKQTGLVTSFPNNVFDSSNFALHAFQNQNQSIFCSTAELTTFDGTSTSVVPSLTSLMEIPNEELVKPSISNLNSIISELTGDMNSVDVPVNNSFRTNDIPQSLQQCQIFASPSPVTLSFSFTSMSPQSSTSSSGYGTSIAGSPSPVDTSTNAVTKRKENLKRVKSTRSKVIKKEEVGSFQRQSRKREQNRAAACRYRQKKKKEIEIIITKEIDLQKEITDLEDEINKEQLSLECLTNLWLELRELNGDEEQI